MRSKTVLIDPIAAYDRIATPFDLIAAHRCAYLEQVERSIIDRFPKAALSMLNVGAGNGSRSARIANDCGVSRLVLLEPSAGMRGAGVAGAQCLPIPAEELGTLVDEFDAILCLWNVLGHIKGRQPAMAQFARLLSPSGVLFVDVINRYNASEYGVLRTAGQFLKDLVRPGDQNGDVVATWNVNGPCATSGHVFTDPEFRSLASNAGLDVRSIVMINYQTGKVQRYSFSGNLLYVLGRAAVIS